MKSSSSQVPKPVTLSQCVATIITFRRLLVVCGIVPLFVAAFPFVVGAYLAFMDMVTAGSGFLSTFMAVVFTVLGRCAISTYAPTAQKRDDALSKSRVSLPLAGFVVGRILISYFLQPIGKWFRLDGMLMSSPKLPYMTALRLSACMLLLGAVVLARFVGPISVVRCSETPLRYHPVSTSIRSFWTRCTSLEAFLGLVAAPNDKPGHLFTSSFSVWRETGLRYQRPSLRASIGQILFSTVMGFLLPHFMPQWERFSYDPLAKMVLIATCVLTLLTHLMISALDGSSHELDPKRYQSVKPLHIMSFRQFPSPYSTFGSAVVIVPAVAVAIAYKCDHENVTFQSSTLSLAFLGLIVTTLISMYLILVNEASKMALCIPGLNITALIKEFSGDASQDELTVMLESILQGNESLVRSVLHPTPTTGVLYAEDEELKRGEANMKGMARVLLFIDRHIESTDARLERDVLAMLLLETLGGQESAVAVDVSTLSPRHEAVVKKWAHPQNAAWLGVARREPSAVPLLRALCAYAGGLGEALQIISLPPHSPERLLLNDGSSQTSWLLPPGARASAEWSIKAASRLIVYSLKSTQGPASDWRSSSLSLLIPVMLHAAFSLRKGTLRFARVNQDKRIVVSASAVEIDWLSGDNRNLQHIVLACDESAILVVKTLKSMDGGNQANVAMSNECRIWLETLTFSNMR